MGDDSMSENRFYVLGVKVSLVNMRMALSAIRQWILDKTSAYVCVAGVHGVMECQRDKRLMEIFNRAGMVTPDGMPLVWLGKLKGHSFMDRVYGPDLLLAVCKDSIETGYKHFFFGGTQENNKKLVDSLCAQFHGIKIVGAFAPPFRASTPEEDEDIIRKINNSGADIVWVGLSTPKQEYWMASHTGKLNAKILIGIGAAFDFVSGIKKQAPYWMQRSGLEWFYRLITEPKRLWKRYLINNPVFLWLVFLESLGLRRNKK